MSTVSTTNSKSIQHIGKIRMPNTGLYGMIINFFTVNGQFVEVYLINSKSLRANSWAVYGWQLEEVRGKWSIIRETLGYNVLDTKDLMRELGDLNKEEKLVVTIDSEAYYEKFLQIFIELVHTPMSYRQAFKAAADMVVL